jgi:hypothetical protein
MGETSKANRVLGLLKRNLHFCSKEVKETAYMYLSSVRLILEYAGTVWEEQLEKVQKRAARFVLNNYSYEEGSMSEIMETLQWKSLKERRRENRLILFYKGLNAQAKIPTTDVLQNNRKNRNTQIDTTSNSTFHVRQNRYSQIHLYTKHRRQRLEHLRPNHAGKIRKL